MDRRSFLKALSVAPVAVPAAAAAMMAKPTYATGGWIKGAKVSFSNDGIHWSGVPERLKPPGPVRGRLEIRQMDTGFMKDMLADAEHHAQGDYYSGC
jgi:hypothetical protein